MRKNAQDYFCLYCAVRLESILKDLFDSSHLPIGQANLDAVGMSGRSGQNVFDETPGQFAAALVFFQNDTHFGSGHDVAPVFPIHYENLLAEKIESVSHRIRRPLPL